MTVLRPLLPALLLVVAALAAPPASAVHEWGHTYMTAGRVLDASGDPAQLLPVRMTLVDSEGSPLTQEEGAAAAITVSTDCSGLFYTTNGNIAHIHIHEHRLSSRQDVQLSVGGENFTHDLRRDMQRDFFQVRLATEVAPRSECEDPAAPRFEEQFAVFGTHRLLQGETIVEPRDRANVTVTLETGGETRVLHLTVDQYDNYFAIFENVTLTDPAAIHAQVGDYNATATLSEEDLAFRAMYHDVNEEKEELFSGISTGFLIFFGAIGVLILAVVGVNYGRRWMETRRAVGSTGRKRSR